jgi:predicted outer membrane repeat protein
MSVSMILMLLAALSFTANAADTIVLVSNFTDSEALPGTCTLHSNGIWRTDCNLRSALAVPGASKIMLAGTKTHKLNIDAYGSLNISAASMDIDIVPFRPNSVPTVTATSSGSAAFNFSRGSLKVSRVNFEECQSAVFYLEGAGSSSAPPALTLEDATFASNSGKKYGSAVYCEECAVLAVRTKFYNNSAVSRGGAIMVSHFPASSAAFASTLHKCALVSAAHLNISSPPPPPPLLFDRQILPNQCSSSTAILRQTF